MALIVCSECGKEFSEKAPACPNCGCPAEIVLNNTTGQHKMPSFNGTLERDSLFNYLSQVFTLENDINTMQSIITRLAEAKKTCFTENIDLGRMPDYEKIKSDYIDEYMASYSQEQWQFHNKFYGLRSASSDLDVYESRVNIKESIKYERENILKKYDHIDINEYIRQRKKRRGLVNPLAFVLGNKQLEKDYEQYISYVDEHNAKVEKRLKEIQEKYNIAIAERNRVLEFNEKQRIIRLQQREYNEGIDQQIARVQSEMNKTEEALLSLYDLNIIYPKYRNIVPVSMFLDYMKSGRRSILEGVNGMYDLYESELLGKKILGELSQIKQNLSHISYQISGIANQLTGIARNQIMIYEEIAKGNEIARKISSTTSSILDNTASMVSSIGDIKTGLSAIQASSEITAYYNEVTSHRIEAIAKIQAYEYSLRHPSFPGI